MSRPQNCWNVCKKRKKNRLRNKFSTKLGMKGKKRIIVTLLFFINIIMLVAAVIPHHHHPNGMICMKQDLPVEQQCPKHHHHPESDACCNSECLTRFQSSIPSIHSYSSPDYVFIATLFTDVIIEHLLRPQEKRVKNYYVFRDSLHGTDFYLASRTSLLCFRLKTLLQASCKGVVANLCKPVARTLPYFCSMKLQQQKENKKLK